MKLSRRQFLRGLALAPCLALPSMAKAQEPEWFKIPLPLIRGGGSSMVAFPQTFIRDDFNRLNEGPPMTGWTDRLGNFVIQSNTAKGDTALTNLTTLDGSSCGPDSEAYLTIIAISASAGQTICVGLRLLSAAVSGYFIAYSSSGRLSLYRVDGGVATELTGSNMALSEGDSIGIRACGSEIIGYLKVAGGAWTQVLSTTDSTYNGAGLLFILLDNDDSACDDFGGGAISCSDPWTPTALPVTTKCAEDPILALVCANGDRLDLITWESGFELDDPGWRPQVAQFKGGGSYANSQIAEGQTLVAGEYDNVVETIPLVARGTSEAACIKTYRRLQQFIKRASDYWKEPSEYDDVWLEVRPNGVGCRTGYARVVKASCADFSNPYGQPFFSPQPYSVADGLSLVVEREPLWRAVQPGTIIGPLYNLLKNPDFEEWNSGVADSQPDCWSDVEVGAITGTNARDTDGPKWGRAAFTVDVTNSTGVGQAKGVTQVAEGTEDGQEYTVVAWVRNAGVTNGVGRLLVTSLLGQYEVYRSATQHGWTLYTFVFTAGTSDVIGVNCEILSTAAGTDGTVYFDSLMLLKGDWEQEAIDGMLPYMTSSHIVNHWDTGAGDLNYVDAWEVPGDGDALVRLEVVNDTTPADFTNVVEKYGLVRVGQRRTKDVQNFQNYHDPAGPASGNVSNSDRIIIPATNPNWQDVTTDSIIGAEDVMDNAGRYRVIARVYDDKASGSPTLRFRLNYWLGVTGAGIKTLDYVTVSARKTWTIVDLTQNAAVIFDSKFRPNPFGALNYTIQISRPAGNTSAGVFDYAMLMPTDGGFLKAEITPGLEKGVALVADNTASSLISASGIRNGYLQKITLDTANGIPPFKEFLGNLYVGLRRLLPTQGGIWRQKDRTWTKVYTTAVPLWGIQTLETYDGKLYGLEYSNVAISLISSSDGTNWTSVAAAAAAGPGYGLKSFNGKLWIGVGSSIYSWDSSALALEFTLPAFGLGQQVSSMEVFGGKLYVSSNDGALNSQVCTYSPTAGWSTIKTFVGDDIYTSKAFSGKFYVGTLAAVGGHIYAFDGATWSVAYDAVGTVDSLSVANENLLAAIRISLGNSQIYQSADGSTWTPFYSTTAISTIDGVTIWSGEVTIAITAASGLAQVWTIVQDEAFEFSIANYQLGGGQNGGFTAPSRRLLDDPRRHRWVVSYDRSDGSNAIADKALVGIGYVPRYLALLGEG